MNRLLLRGGLSRATFSSGSQPFSRTTGFVVRYQSSEEVARDQQEDDDVEAGNAVSALAGERPPLRQVNGSSVAHRGEGVAIRRRPAWPMEGTQPQNGLRAAAGGDHLLRFARSGQAGGSGRAAVSAPPVRARGALNGADASPLSRFNGKGSPAVAGDEGSSHVVNDGAGEPTVLATRNVAPRPRHWAQNNSSDRSSSGNSSSNRRIQNPWDSLLKLKDGEVGANGVARAMESNRVADITAAGAAARRSDPLRSMPYATPNGASNLKVGGLL